jgi:secernin
MDAPPPLSCDTFVSCFDGTTVFGKNSDRPQEEVQNVVYVPGAVHNADQTVQCTYISIPQVGRTYDVVLCQPHWMWGAEMGANECGVVVGNEAVWGRIPATADKKLLGMDFVRLLLERCNSADQAVDCFAGLLEEHGQGGPCDIGTSWSYHNGYLIADAKEAWIIESVDKWWIAQRVTQKTRNISNGLSIRDQYDKVHPGLLDFCKQQGWWDGKSPFNWKVVVGGEDDDGDDEAEVSISSSGYDRETKGRAWLQHFSSKNTKQIGVRDMFTILRDTEGGISMEGAFRTTASMVALLGHEQPRFWFTGTPHPHASAFKPFSFPAADEKQALQQDKAWALVDANRTCDPAKLWWRHENGGANRAHDLLKLEEEYFDCRSSDAFLKATQKEMTI